MPSAPSRVRWTDHAAEKAAMLGMGWADVERILVQGHRRRTRNPGSGDWRVLDGRIVIVYDHPDRDDASVARVITLWRR